MGLRKRYGKWEYRLWVNGRCYSDVTGLGATERNKNAAIREMEEHRTAILEGRSLQRRIQIVPFTEAAEMFLQWANGEYREHPATARRLACSFTSLKEFFDNTPASSLSEGQIDDYKSWRRTKHEIREITLRHDLHALSGFFKYAIKHNWARANPVRNVEIPSDADAVRMHIVTPGEEMLYFADCLQGQKIVHIKSHQRKSGVVIGAHDRTVDTDLRNLHDLGRLMLNQGCRPEELVSLRKESIDLEHGTLRIPQGKSTAARRSLKLLPESRSILARRMEGESPWIFPSEVKLGQHITKLNNAHQRVLEDTGLRFVLYDFRHTAATRWAERGMPLATLAKILGHSNLRSVMKYVHPSQEHMDEAMLRFGEPEKKVTFRSSSSVEKGDLGGSGGMEGETAARLQLTDKKGKIQ
jgi:Site-specific recombinase XerD